MGDVAGVKPPFAAGQRVQGFQRVQLFDSGGRQIFELTHGRERLRGTFAGQG